MLQTAALSEMATLELVNRLPDLLRSSQQGSLIEYTKATRVEPIVLMDQRALHLPYAGDIMHSLSSIFTGYYLQAVALSVNVGKVDTLKLLDKLNPNRDPVGNFIGSLEAMVSTESYKYKLPRIGEVASMEASNSFRNGKNTKDTKDLIKEASKNSFRSGKDTLNLIKEASNLSVGKLIEIEIGSEGQKATFPIAVRLIVSGIDPKSLTHTLAIGSGSAKTVKERFHAWRAGQLRFVRDLILCQDLIDEHRKTLLRDKSNFYSNTLKRRNKNRVSAIITKSPSIATASSIFVMTETTAKELESEVGGRLKDFKTREKIFKETYGMLMVVIDTEWEQVTIYHRSIDTPTELSLRDIKSGNKGSGPDVFEILKAYQLGNSPSI